MADAFGTRFTIHGGRHGARYGLGPQALRAALPRRLPVSPRLLGLGCVQGRASKIACAASEPTRERLGAHRFLENMSSGDVPKTKNAAEHLPQQELMIIPRGIIADRSIIPKERRTGASVRSFVSFAWRWFEILDSQATMAAGSATARVADLRDSFRGRNAVRLYYRQWRPGLPQ